MKLTLAFLASAAGTAELEFSDSNKKCNLKYDGTSLSTNCKLSTGFADATLGTRVTKVEKDVKYLMGLVQKPGGGGGGVLPIGKGNTGWDKANAAESCQQILANGFSKGNMAYWLKPQASSAPAFQAYCEMANGGGGWLLVAKVKKHSSAMNNRNTAQWRTGTNLGSTTTLSDQDALGPGYKESKFNDVMMANLGDTSRHVAWRHPATRSNLLSVAQAGNRISDGARISGKPELLSYDRGDASYHNFCNQVNKYGFFGYDHSQSGSIAGHNMQKGHCGAFVAISKYSHGDPGRCISDFGLGGSYGNGASKHGICAHWWGAGDSHTKDYHSIGLFIRHTPKLNKNDGDGTTAKKPGMSCRQLQTAGKVLTSGSYWINPNKLIPYQVYCERTILGGGWTLVAKVKKGSQTMNNFNTAAWRQGTTLNNVKKLTNEDALGKSYSQVPFNDVMMADLANPTAGYIAWRHPGTFTSMLSIAQAGNRISDGVRIGGSAGNLKYDRGDASYHNFCEGKLKYGFFGYDHSQSGSIAGHNMQKGHCGAFVAISRYAHGDPGRCISDFGLGGSYGNGKTKPGICAHWWGAGDSHTKDFHSIGLYVRYTAPIVINNGNGSAKTAPGNSCEELQAAKHITSSGKYWINPNKNYPFEVFCDTTTLGGGWTLVAKVKKGSSIMNNHNINAWRNGKPQGDCSNLNNGDCMSSAFSTTDFNEVMIASLSSVASRHVAWRHPTLYSSMKSVALAGNRINDGQLVSGSVDRLGYDRGDASYHNICKHNMKYGFFGYDHSQSGSIAGHNMQKGHCGAFVAVSQYKHGDPGRCISDFGLGGSYGNGATKPGICAHWWGAGDSHTKDYQSVGLFVRKVLKVLKNDGDGSSKINPASDCKSSKLTSSGTYWINPSKAHPFQAYCEKTINGGGWTLVAKYKQGSRGMNSYNLAWNTGKPQGDCSRLSDEDALGPAYSVTKVRDVMIAALANPTGSHVAWRHPTTYSSLKQIAQNGYRIKDGSVISGSAGNLKYNRGDASYHNFCGDVKYGFFGYDHSQSGSIAGHGMTKGHCGAFVAISRYAHGDPGRCISDFGLGGSYGNGKEKPGLCAHWWGAGDSHTKDFHSVGLFVRS